MLSQNTQHLAKVVAGKAAADLIRDGMLVGLGTGSTAAEFITALGVRCQLGLHITAVATSRQSEKQAIECRIPLVDINEVNEIDITVDGADEIDPQLQMIKGGGGALLREKIIASMSREMVIVVDWTKQVPILGGVPLPVEIVPFAYKALIYKIKSLGYKGDLRMQPTGSPYVTDNGNYLFDIDLNGRCANPTEVENQLTALPGVVETGFFLEFADHVITGYPDGHINMH